MPTIQCCERFVGLTVLAKIVFFKIEQNWTRIGYKTLGEITNMSRKMSSKDSSVVKQVSVSTLREKQYLAKQQSFVIKIT